MRRSLVAGNWKMNGTLASVRTLCAGLSGGADRARGVETVVCPPFVYLSAVAAALDGTGIALGAQDLAKEPSGAFTGEVAGSMLADCGCTHVIVGHSERRGLYGETDGLIADKYLRAREDGLVPIVCVGETLEERESDVTRAVIERQVDAVLAAAGAGALAAAVVAYEPVWAIGTGKTATPEQAQAVHRLIRDRVAEHDRQAADALRILYGGSVKAANAPELFAMPDIDGGLIGGASLDPNEFLGICEAAR